MCPYQLLVGEASLAAACTRTISTFSITELQSLGSGRPLVSPRFFQMRTLPLFSLRTIAPLGKISVYLGLFLLLTF